VVESQRSWIEGGYGRLTEGAESSSDAMPTAEPDGDSGWAVTAAGFWAPAKWLRLGLEYLVLRADRPAAQYSGDDPDTDARRLLAEVRLVF
jgi:hypothetical protein